jgi:predicted 3-demethylubiquinone-9 3-methyltransferase (glyoxalase superfamily)
MIVTFKLEGQEFTAPGGGPRFKFDEAISFVINCETQEEMDYYWDSLTADGGQESQCGWLKDKFGLSWQIVPTIIGELMSDEDPEKSGRVMQAVLQMKKLDLQKMKDAAAGR